MAAFLPVALPHAVLGPARSHQGVQETFQQEQSRAWLKQQTPG